MSDRTGQLVVEIVAKSPDRTGQPAVEKGQELNTERSKCSPTVRLRLEDTNSRLIMTEEVYENWVKLLSRSKKNFIVLKQKNFNDEINNFFMNGYYSKIRNYVKLIIKVSKKWMN